MEPFKTVDTAEKILFLFLGWLLGLLSPIIVDTIKRRRELKEFKKALITELREVQFRLMATVYLVATHMGKYDRNLLEWIRPIAERYTGINRIDRIFENVQKHLALTDDQLNIISERMAQDQNRGLNFKKYVVPLLDSKISHLHVFDQESQNVLLEIKTRLNLIHEDIDQYRFYFNQTFNSSLSSGNLELIRGNIRDSYENISQQARITADLIQRILE